MRAGKILLVVLGLGFVLLFLVGLLGGKDPLDGKQKADLIKEECKRQFPYNEIMSNDCAIKAMTRIILEDRAQRYESGYKAGR